MWTAATVPDLFAERVRASPDAIAMVVAGATPTGSGVSKAGPVTRQDAARWTFDELNEWSNRLARTLVEHGAGPGGLVALALPRALTVPAILGVLKSGAAYLPLDPDQPQDRAAFVIADAAPALLLTVRDRPGPLPTTCCTRPLFLDDLDLDARSALDLTDADRHRPLQPRDPASTIYSAGQDWPEGVVVQHDHAVRLLADAASAVWAEALAGLAVGAR